MSVRNSKALIGALFIQYCAYGIFYIMDEFKQLAPQVYKEIQQNAGAPPEEEKEEAPQGAKGKLKAFFS